MAWLIILPDWIFYLILALIVIWGVSTMSLFYLNYRYMVSLYNRVQELIERVEAHIEGREQEPKEEPVAQMENTNPFANLVLLDSDHLGY